MVKIYYKLASAQAYTFLKDDTDNQELVTGLQPDTEYDFRVDNIDAQGNVWPSSVLRVRTAMPPATPKPVTNFTAVPQAGGTTVLLSWTNPA